MNLNFLLTWNFGGGLYLVGSGCLSEEKFSNVLVELGDKYLLFLTWNFICERWFKLSFVSLFKGWDLSDPSNKLINLAEILRISSTL